MKARTLVTTFSTSLIVAGLAAVWTVTSPLAASCAAAVPPEQITSAPAESSEFVSAINQLRRSQGLNDLAVNGNLTSVAQDWAVHMAGEDGISHRANLSDGIYIDWRRLGENVGMGPNVDDLMQAFIASPGHYKNLVDATFTHVGVGTVRTPDGLLYTAHEFAAVQGASASPPATSKPPAPRAPRATTPRPTTPRVASVPKAPVATVPPTTTTTEAPVTVERSTAEQDELQNGGAENHQQQQNKNEGRCRAHGARRVVALGAAATSR
ncbi:MAG TPA: CAP domain-containing protein [Acidimicrobiales bacterium]|nr:CAP domain-containing protein [Acidimicrobiales bacterium]